MLSKTGSAACIENGVNRRDLYSNKAGTQPHPYRQTDGKSIYHAKNLKLESMHRRLVNDCVPSQSGSCNKVIHLCLIARSDYFMMGCSLLGNKCPCTNIDFVIIFCFTASYC